jgi:hypothetical protein
MDSCQTDGRLARQLEDLLRSTEGPCRESAPDASSAMIEAARRDFEARRQRDGIFGAGTFADPAWYLLLDLFVAGEEDRRVDAFSLCGRTALPEGVILRSIAHLVQSNLVTRQAKAGDPRSIYLVLTAEGQARMVEYLSRRVADGGAAAA